MQRALITGITGQIGSYLAEFLLSKGYEVHGAVRRTSSLDRIRLDSIYLSQHLNEKKLHLHYAELNDITSYRRLLQTLQPQEVYHLAGQSHVGISFEIPESTCELTAMATLRLLELIKDMPNPPKFYHASSSEIFGNITQSPQTENTPQRPTSPYGVAKAFATHMTRLYRETFQLFACNGIMYNHESIRRGENFVTRKICRAAAAIAVGQQKKLLIGDTTAKRDWGYAPDLAQGIWLSLQHSQPDDYIFATGELHSVQDIIDITFQHYNLDQTQYIQRDPRFLRPAEPTLLLGDPTKARTQLNWQRTITFKDMIIAITDHEFQKLQNHQ